MIVAEPYVSEKKPRGGAQPGAGRPRKNQTPFSEWAKAKGYSATDLARVLEIGVSTAQRLLSENMRPSLELAERIAALSTEPSQPPTFPSSYWLKIPKHSSS